MHTIFLWIEYWKRFVVLSISFRYWWKSPNYLLCLLFEVICINRKQNRPTKWIFEKVFNCATIIHSAYKIGPRNSFRIFRNAKKSTQTDTHTTQKQNNNCESTHHNLIITYKKKTMESNDITNEIVWIARSSKHTHTHRLAASMWETGNALFIVIVKSFFHCVDFFIFIKDCVLGFF